MSRVTLRARRSKKNVFEPIIIDVQMIIESEEELKELKEDLEDGGSDSQVMQELFNQLDDLEEGIIIGK